jgi:hypothetical protein
LGARAKVVGQALGGGAQVRTGGQVDEADRETLLVANSHLDTVVGDDEGHFLT